MSNVTTLVSRGTRTPDLRSSNATLVPSAPGDVGLDLGLFESSVLGANAGQGRFHHRQRRTGRPQTAFRLLPTPASSDGRERCNWTIELLSGMQSKECILADGRTGRVAICRLSSPASSPLLVVSKALKKL